MTDNTPDNNNTIFGWILFSGIVALGLSIVSGKYFHANNPEAPEKPGLFIEAEEEGAGGPAEMSMDAALNMMPQDELVAAGSKVFNKCSTCHTMEQGGANGIGPNLYGIMGKSLAGVAGFAYSSALSEKGGQWDWETMNAWLKSPAAFASGTKMSFAGLSKIEDRAAVSAYMNSYGSNLPVPEYVEEVVAEADEGEAVDGEEPAEGEVAEAEAEQDAAAEVEEAAAE